MRLLNWLIAINPITLTSSISSVIIGSSVLINLNKYVDALRLAATVIGVSMLQASANLVDDYFDYLLGLDRPGSQRRKHPILDLGIRPRDVARAAAALTIIGGLIGVMLAVTSANTLPVIAVMLIGAVVVWQYSAPPLRLRHRGLGEVVSPVVMGPLIAVGTFLVLNGGVDQAWLAALAAIPNMAMTLLALLAADLDHLDQDKIYGKRTMATVFGERVVRRLAEASIAMYVVGILVSVLLGALPWCTLIAATFVIIPATRLRSMSTRPGVMWRTAFMGRLAYAASALITSTLKTLL